MKSNTERLPSHAAQTFEAACHNDLQIRHLPDWNALHNSALEFWSTLGINILGVQAQHCPFSFGGFGEAVLSLGNMFDPECLLSCAAQVVEAACHYDLPIRYFPDCNVLHHSGLEFWSTLGINILGVQTQHCPCLLCCTIIRQL